MRREMLMKKKHGRILILLFGVMAILLPVSPVFSQVLQRYDFTGSSPRILRLSSSLREISGLAVSPDGRLFAHNDEVSSIFQLDRVTGRVVKKFHIVTDRWFRKGRIEDDFEDIAIAGDRFFLVTSEGTLYEFREGKENEKVMAAVYKTGIGKAYEVEGLCYDPHAHALLLGCKDGSGKKKTADRPVFSFSLRTMRLEKSVRFLIDARVVAASAGKKSFRPSALVRHPLSGNFLVLSAASRIIAEIDSRSGALLRVTVLPPVLHPQPEGLAVTADNTILIANEDLLQGTLVEYPLKKR